MTFVVKIGGDVVNNPELLNVALVRCASLAHPFVLVHGGGNVATSLAKELGVEQHLVDGRRVTDAHTLRIVVMAYAGQVNKDIVARLQALGVQCLGVTGADADLVRAHKRTHHEIDYGYVGDIDHVNVEVLAKFIELGLSVVVAPITHDGNGQLLNTNADTIAAEIAMAIVANGRACSLRYAFSYQGVMSNVEDPDSTISTIDSDKAIHLAEQGVVTKGMLPKLENATRAAEAGVDVRIQHAEMIGLDTGTLIT